MLCEPFLGIHPCVPAVVLEDFLFGKSVALPSDQTQRVKKGKSECKCRQIDAKVLKAQLEKKNRNLFTVILVDLKALCY